MTSRLLRAKVVMLGAPGVGKTSLVQRYVHSRFSDEYLSTLGVKVDRKSVEVDDTTVAMLLWDVHGETEGLDVPTSYLKGATAAITVVDASRPETIDKAAELAARVVDASPHVTVHRVANKSDLTVDWADIESRMSAAGSASFARTSAKDGDGVEALFEAVASGIVAAAN